MTPDLPAAAPFRPVRLGTARHAFEHRADGSILVRCLDPLGDYPKHLTERLEHWARLAPDRSLMAKREAGGAWRHLSYGDAHARAGRFAAALRARHLSAERPLVILSGNDLDHACLALGAMAAGIPYAPISPAYAAPGSGFARLRAIIRLLTPGLVYAADGTGFAPAVAAAVPPEVEVVTADGTLPGRRATPLASLEAEGGSGGGGADVGPDTIAKFLFTSGSTGDPKAVITTHRMLCANAAQLGASFPCFADEPPVLVDWLPWHHVFGGSHNVDIVLFNGGTLYIDDGRPTPAAIAETVRNLREVSPTCYLTVPKGYEALIPHLRADPALRERFFKRLTLAFFAAAGLPQPVWDAFDEVAVGHVGRRIAMLTGLGATESAPFALVCDPAHCRSGRVGLPARGVELKLAPVEGKLEARVRGPNITPGYWRNAGLTAAAYDEEGYYRFGDALRFVDPARPEIGFQFDGRLSEDFKLTSGVWVSVGALRARFLDAAAPYARDVAIAGEGRSDIRVLVVPDLDACRALAPDRADVAAAPEVLGAFADILTGLGRQATGSSNRIVAALLLEEPPSLDRGEMTDKGSINQRATLAARAALVDELYGDARSPRTIMPDREYA